MATADARSAPATCCTSGPRRRSPRRATAPLPATVAPAVTESWEIEVLHGPHSAPDFFTPEDITELFAAEWRVHYNSSRTGVRLIGPKPRWARRDGGEAGLHPSNIHDNAYAVGTIDFTGDMPVILGPDGPSLGGFVCPATIVSADLWKVGQLKAGDRVRFRAVSLDEARALERAQEEIIRTLQAARGQAAARAVAGRQLGDPAARRGARRSSGGGDPAGRGRQPPRRVRPCRFWIWRFAFACTRSPRRWARGAPREFSI